MKRILLPTLLALATALPLGAQAANEAWDKPVTLQIGAFRADAETNVRLDTNLGGPGTSVSFESTLGLTRTKTLPDFEFLWRINPRHGLEASYVSLQRDGSRTLTGEIRFGEAVFPVNTSVSSSFDSDVLRVAYRYSPINEGGNELAFLLGLHYTKLSTSIASAAGTVSDSASVDVPLPTIGVRGGVRFADNFRVTGFAQALKLKVGDYDGELINAGAAVEWAFLPNAYAGVGYNYYKYELTSDKDRARGQFNFRFDGPTLYAAWAF
jgi:hypothetical protein